MKPIILPLLLLFTISCSNDNDSIGTQPEYPNLIEFTTIAESVLTNYYTNTGQQNIIIENNTEWNAFLTNMDWLAPSMNNIDFAAQTVLVVFDEPHATGGYEIAIQSITEFQNQIEVIILQSGNGDATQIITQPWQVVVTHKLNKPVIFQYQ